MLYHVYGIPIWAFSALTSVIFGGSTWLTIVALRPLVHSRLRSEQCTNDLVGFTFSSFAVFCGMLLGLLAVAAYQNDASVDDSVTREAGGLAALYHPAVLWCVVALGALTAIVVLSLFDTELRVHLLLGGLFSLFLGMMVFLIAAMDYPFRGELSVSPEAFQRVCDSLMQPH